MIKPRHGEEGLVYISNNARIEDDVDIDTTGSIVIEDDVEISSGVVILTHKHIWSLKPRKEDNKIEKCIVVIHEDAFIGVRAIILPSVTIGTGAVIGAGAVVTKDVPAYEIWAGNPARKIDERE